LKSLNRESILSGTMADLEEKLRILPRTPGVYLFKDKQGKVIYIGKALVLRNRVRQYFQQGNDGRYQYESLVSHIADLEIIATDTELEALILEQNLVRERKPRYNIDLRDDKSFPFLRITNEPFPRVFLTRRPVQDGSRYFGPYSDLYHLKGLIRVLRGMLKIRSCNLPLAEQAVVQGKFKVCLQFHIGRCNAPCVANESREEYAAHVRDFVDVTSGRGADVIRRLQREMDSLAENLRFEQAAQLRDWLTALDNLTQRQKMISTEPVNRDIIGLAVEDDIGCLVILQVRAGRMVGRLDYRLKQLSSSLPEEILVTALERYYSNPVSVPDEIILPGELPDTALFGEWLRDKAQRRVEIKVPERGDKARLTELADRNAALVLEEYRLAQKSLERIPHSLSELQKHLKLPRLPQEIAAFDISTLQGTDKVASMVVFRKGRPARSEYRRFKIRTVAGMDDFACMREVVMRRFTRLKKEEQPYPDLVLIDGGKGQLAAACDALNEAGVTDQALIGLAKQLEEIYLPGDSQPHNLPRTSSALKLLQQIRDEAHRFAITYHRQLRGKRSFVSVLDDIEGVGPTRRKILLAHFGSLRTLQQASADEIAKAEGIPRPIAERIAAFFANRNQNTAL
jgi:excinuclease ABC subunit C